MTRDDLLAELGPVRDVTMRLATAAVHMRDESSLVARVGRILLAVVVLVADGDDEEVAELDEFVASMGGGS